MTAPTLLNIPLANLEDNPVALREVDKDSLAFAQLRDSIKKDGLLNAINVVIALMPDGKTPKRDSAGNPIYRICDGLHRTTACRELGFETIPAQVLSKSDAEIEIAQLVANAHRVDTKPFQYSQHLVRILGRDSTMTVNELAARVSMSPSWLNERLGLVNLHPDLGKLVDEGDITVSNAVDLAKLRPVEEQLAFAQAAMEDSPAVFAPKVKARIKDIRDAKRAGRDPNAVTEFQPVAHLRKKSEVEAEATSPNVIAAALKAAGITDPVQAAQFALKWAVHLDEQSVREAKAKEEARKKQMEQEKIKRAAERAQLRAQEATQKAASLTPST
jgi:ParB/RepB/Spo0J family partition protein